MAKDEHDNDMDRGGGGMALDGISFPILTGAISGADRDSSAPASWKKAKLVGDLSIR